MSSGLSVLVVDDHPLNRRILTEILSLLGCSVTTAADGLEALAASSVTHFDLICLDRNMPVLSGDEVVCCLSPDQFVLAWSTDDRALPHRFNGMLAKPVSITAVEDAIGRAKAWRANTTRRTAAWLQLAAA